MPRKPREKSSSGIYHIMLRGINRQTIFEDDEDRISFLGTLKRYQKVSEYQIYGYCLMGNHLHLLINEARESVSLAMQRICSSYVHWYNYKYERCGHLFQERFKSESVEDDAYFLTVLRYIHQNPIKAGLANSVSTSKWTSYKEYLDRAKLVNTDYGLNLFSRDREKALALFTTYMNEENEDQCLDDEQKVKLSDDELRQYLDTLGITNISTLQQMEKAKRDELLIQLKELEGVTIRQLSRITGISKSVIARVR
ncbi:transposase [Peptococcaceae bacterium 1198_IL3148]